MSHLKILEKAALSLSGDERRQLLAFLSSVVEKQDAPAQNDAPGSLIQDKGSLHPALLPMIGIIPSSADAEGIHEYRLLKHT